MKRGAETKDQAARRFAGRATFVLCVFGLVAVALLARAVQLQVFNTDFLNQQADARHLRTEGISAHRGTITDRHGEPLAISTPVDSIWANPKKLASSVNRISPLAKLLSTDEQALARRITSSLDKEFIYLRRHMTPTQAEQVMSLKLPGVSVQREYRRYYPAGEVASHLIGYTNIDDQGQEGLERAFDPWLSGEHGSKRVLKDRYGRAVEQVDSIRPPSHGKELRTSIDLRIQYYAYRTLKTAIQRYKAESGSIVVLDVTSGEVLGMANQPSFNPNDRSQYNARNVRNRAITDIFEPGSSVKPLVIAAALESGRYLPTSIVNTSPGFVDVGPKRIEDSRNLGNISLTTVLARSSNVGMTKLAMTLEPEQMWTTLASFGLGQLTGISFPGESAGSLPIHLDWRPISQATMAYGYGLSVTPLQLAQAYSALGNGGEIKPLSLLATESSGDGQQVIEPSTAIEVRRMLEEVVRPDGTGTKAAVTGYRVAGKTGTAWKAEAGSYSKDEHISIFAGLAPASDPRLAVVVVIDEPRGELYYGSDVAAPVFSEVMTESLRLLAVAPDAMPPRDDGMLAQAVRR